MQDGVAHLGRRICQLQAKHFLCLQEQHAKEHVCNHATRDGTHASNDIIQQDNTSKNKKLVTMAHLQDWKLKIVFENTARKNPQQKSYAALAFTVIVAKTRAVMNVAQIPKKQVLQIVE
jgi:hypothetical protein